jgi:hypothetical protein
MMAIFVFLMLSCGNKQFSEKKRAMANLKEEASEAYIADEPAKSLNAESKVGGSKKDLSFVFLSPYPVAKDRYLEFMVELQYDTKNFELSRKDLLDIVSQNGFLNYSSAAYENLRYRMTAQANIKASELYNVIKLLDKLGSLKVENTSVIDHTRDMAWNQRKVKREQTRMDRINKAMAQVPPQNKTWKEKEDALEKSEDSLDQSQHEEWNIQDLVAWAKVTITLYGPLDSEPISIPSFNNALALLINGFFKLLYLLIILLPFALVGLFIWWQRKRIGGWFKKK